MGLLTSLARIRWVSHINVSVRKAGRQANRRWTLCLSRELTGPSLVQVYHASRESFLYLKQFYMGEIKPEDREHVPCHALPSEEFLDQLHEYTIPFRSRLTGQAKAFKSF